MAPLFALREDGDQDGVSSSSSSSGEFLFGRSLTSKANKGKDKATTQYSNPWADRPWPLIEPPSRRQHITHPVIHIANEISQIHNAMIRGLNAIYLQAPNVQKVQDVVDLLFLTQTWSAWVLDHHDLKEGTLLPGFEGILGLRPNVLTLRRGDSGSDSGVEADASPSLPPSGKDSGIHLNAIIEGTKEGENSRRGTDTEEELSFFLRRVYAYSTAIHKEPQSYNATIFEPLLASLGDILVPHLTIQVDMVLGMREMCFAIPPALALPTPKIIITASSPENPTMRPALIRTSTSLAPFNPRPVNRRTQSSSALPEQKVSTIPVPDSAKLFEAEDRANKLLQFYLSADGQASAAMDRYIVPPMIVGLRDITFSPPLTFLPPSPPPASAVGSLLGGKTGSVRGSICGGGGGFMGGSTSDWPRLSVPAIHAVADKLSPRHAGAWRFLPCDVWGRPRELPFAS
ncbi:hypothetical protein GGR57DRAFT_280459 [Xylariaceae sp. FL1272]|nr:hypothetical protein GGR57DRAFT_280459 [Xylariaceae sp. FL1272]